LTGCGVLQFGARSLLPGPRVSEFVLETPPVDLPASGAHGTPATQSIVTPVAVPVDGWLHGFSFDVVDSAGADVPKPVVHHISLRDPKKRDLFAPVMLRVIAAGQETGTVRLPTVVGYPFSDVIRFCSWRCCTTPQVSLTKACVFGCASDTRFVKAALRWPCIRLRFTSLIRTVPRISTRLLAVPSKAGPFGQPWPAAYSDLVATSTVTASGCASKT
jgi:hypothetical protein